MKRDMVRLSLVVEVEGIVCYDRYLRTRDSFRESVFRRGVHHCGKQCT